MGRGNKTDACPSGIACFDHEQPEHEVTVSDYYLDEFEVTVGQFRRFVEAYEKAKAGAGAHPKIPDSGWKSEWDSQLPNTVDHLKLNLNCNADWQTWRDTAEETEQDPLNFVNWYVAFALCAWDGGRLPTGAEWEYATAGGAENRLYSWGQEAPDKTRASYYGLYDGSAAEVLSFADIAKGGMPPAGQGLGSIRI